MKSGREARQERRKNAGGAAGIIGAILIVVGIVLVLTGVGLAIGAPMVVVGVGAVWWGQRSIRRA